MSNAFGLATLGSVRCKKCMEREQMKTLLTDDIKNFTNDEFAELLYEMRLRHNSGNWEGVRYNIYVEVVKEVFKEKFGRDFRGIAHKVSDAMTWLAIEKPN